MREFWQDFMSSLILCPECGHAGGNTIDRERGITLDCQWCGYGRRRAEAAMAWNAVRQSHAPGGDL